MLETVSAQSVVPRATRHLPLLTNTSLIADNVMCTCWLSTAIYFGLMGEGDMQSCGPEIGLISAEWMQFDIGAVTPHCPPSQ